MKRLAVVVGVALVGFAASFVVFGDAARQGCVVDVPADDAYTATLEQPVKMSEPHHTVLLAREGQPVTGVRVCLYAEMVGMSGMGVSGEGREVAPGRFEVPMDFAMGGPWQGRVLIFEGGTAHAAVPVTFDVVADVMVN